MKDYVSHILDFVLSIYVVFLHSRGFIADTDLHESYVMFSLLYFVECPQIIYNNNREEK